MATTITSYPTPQRTIELKDDFSDVESINGLVVLACGSDGTLNVPAVQTQAQITAARLASVSSAASRSFLAQQATAPPTIGPNDGSTLDFLNQDGQVYQINFGDGNQLTFSGTVGEMATVTMFQSVYSLKSASNPNITLVQGVQVATPPTFGGASQNI